MNRLEERLSRLEADAGIVEHDCRPHALVRIIVDPQLGAIGEMRRIVPCPVCGKGERYNTPYVKYDTPRLSEGVPRAAGKIADANAALESDPAKKARWYAADRSAIRADVPDAIALLPARGHIIRMCDPPTAEELAELAQAEAEGGPRIILHPRPWAEART